MALDVAPQFKDFSQSIVAVSLFASNILFWRESGYFEAAAEEKPLLHTWSLAVEEQYYVFFPIILILLWRFGRNPVFCFIVAISILSLLLSEWGWRNQPTANFYLAPTRAWELLAGSICAFLQFGKSQKSNNTVSVLGFALIVFSIFYYDERIPFPSIYALAPVLGTALIIMYGAHDTWVARLLSRKAFVGIGLISYSAYLWHQPLFAFARIRSIHEPAQWLMLILAFGSLALAYCSWQFIEQPFRTGIYPVFPSQSAIFKASGVTAAVFICGGALMTNIPPSISPDIKARIELLNSLKAERQSAVLAHKCHFNPDTTRIDDFIGDWDCLHNDEASLKSLAVGIYGDSHAADKSLAFRSAGFDFLQLGGAYCPLIPENTQRLYCNALLEHFHRIAAEQKITTVFLANRMSKHELDHKHISDIIEYWSSRYSRVIIFTPMPEFSNFETIFIRGGTAASGILQFGISGEEEFFAAVELIVVPGNVEFLNTRELFCSDRYLCDPIIDGVPLVTDGHHRASLEQGCLAKRFML